MANEKFMKILSATSLQRHPSLTSLSHGSLAKDFFFFYPKSIHPATNTICEHLQCRTKGWSNVLHIETNHSIWPSTKLFPANSCNKHKEYCILINVRSHACDYMPAMPTSCFSWGSWCMSQWVSHRPHAQSVCKKICMQFQWINNIQRGYWLLSDNNKSRDRHAISWVM